MWAERFVFTRRCPDTFAGMIKGGWYKILAYRDPQSGRWRQKSRGAVSQQKAWQLNEDRRLRLKTDTLPKGSEELVTALKMAIGDLGLVLGSIRARQSEDFEEDIAGAAAAFDLAANKMIELVAADDDLLGQVDRAVGFGIVRMRMQSEDTNMAEETTLPATPVIGNAIRDLVEGYNQMSRGIDSLAEVAGTEHGAVNRLQELTEQVCEQMRAFKGFAEVSG